MQIPQKKQLKMFGIGFLCALLLSVTVFMVYAQTLTTMTLTGGIYPGAPSYTIWREDSTYYSKDASGLIEFSGTNMSYVLNSIIASSNDGDFIFSKNGIYEFDSKIIFTHKITLSGEAMGNENDMISGTIFKYNSANSIDAFLDMRNHTGNLENLKITQTYYNAFGSGAPYNNGAYRGIYAGAETNIVGKGKYQDWRNVYVYNFYMGIDYDNFGTDDSVFTNIFVGNAHVGISHISAMNKLVGGTIFNSQIGLEFYQNTTEETGWLFYGLIMSGVSTAIKLQGSHSLYGASFFNAWFEGLDKLFDMEELSSVSAGSWLFANSVLTLMPLYLTWFDMTDKTMRVEFQGGTMYHIGGGISYISSNSTNGNLQWLSVNVYGGKELIEIRDFNNTIRGINVATLQLLNEAEQYYTVPVGAVWTNFAHDSKATWNQYSIVKAYAHYIWNPNSTSGKVRMNSVTNFGESAPNTVGWREDLIDITNATRFLGYSASIGVQEQDNGVSAPIFSLIEIIYMW